MTTPSVDPGEAPVQKPLRSGAFLGALSALVRPFEALPQEAQVPWDPVRHRVARVLCVDSAHKA